MSHARRAADRRSKQRGRRTRLPASPGSPDGQGSSDKDEIRADAPAVEGGSGLQTPFIENLHAPVSGRDRFAAICDHLRDLQDIRCEVGCAEWGYQLKSESPESVAIEMRCECGRVERVLDISRNEFTERAGEVFD